MLNIDYDFDRETIYCAELAQMINFIRDYALFLAEEEDGLYFTWWVYWNIGMELWEGKVTTLSDCLNYLREFADITYQDAIDIILSEVEYSLKSNECYIPEWDRERYAYKDAFWMYEDVYARLGVPVEAQLTEEAMRIDHKIAEQIQYRDSFDWLVSDYEDLWCVIVKYFIYTFNRERVRDEDWNLP